jgi:transposase-like protein
MNAEKNEFPETLTAAVRYFADAQNAFNFVKMMKWPSGCVTCPKCSSDNVGFISTRTVWKCRDCKKQFSVKVGTIFEDSALGLDKWLPAFWMIVNAKNGISSCELARAIGVTQKSAWHMLHRIRLAVQDDSVERYRPHPVPHWLTAPNPASPKWDEWRVTCQARGQSAMMRLSAVH